MARKFMDGGGLLYLWSKIVGKFVAKEDGKGLSTNDYTSAEKTKLSGIETGANKYVHPTHTAKSSGLYKITVDATGHVSAAAAVAKADITKLGIPASDTTYSPATATKDGLMSATDKTKLDDVSSTVEDLVAAGGEANVIESVSVNGTALPITSKGVNVTVPTKISTLTDDVGIATDSDISTLTTTVNGKANKSTTLAGYGITDAYTKTQTDTAIATAVANASHTTFEVVSSIPTAATAVASVMYLVMNSQTNHYDIYTLIQGEGVLLDDTTVDLTGYMKITDMEVVTNAEIDAIVNAS